jgi:multiple sugar transport system ATP-binding protein
VREPNLFLFDEPIAHLDAKLRAHMRGEIKHLQRTLGTTMIYVTHDQLEAMSMADTIAVMHDGELQQLGTPREVYNKPVNAWVAGFVGEPAMNFVDVGVEDVAGKTCFRHPNFAISVNAEQQRLIAGGAKANTLRMGIRPDAMAISMTKPADEHITGKIFVTELLGGDMIIDVDLEVSRIRVKTSTEFEGVEGQTCYMTVNRDKWHAFSKENGKALF